MTDPVERSDDLDRRILAIPAHAVFSRRQVYIMFSIVIATLVLVILLVLLIGRSALEGRDHTITRQNDRIEEQDRTIEGLQEQVSTLQDQLLGLIPPGQDANLPTSILT